MIAGGTPPEVAWHGGLFARFAGSGQLRPVDDYLARDRDVRPADFYPTSWENTRFGGKVMGLPYMTQTFVVHYNKNLFRAAGLDAPKEDWTFDDLLTAARRLNRPEQLWGARFDDYLGCYILYGGRAAPDYSRVTVSNPTNQGVLQFLRDTAQRAPGAAQRGPPRRALSSATSPPTSSSRRGGWPSPCATPSSCASCARSTASSGTWPPCPGSRPPGGSGRARPGWRWSSSPSPPEARPPTRPGR